MQLELTSVLFSVSLTRFLDPTVVSQHFPHQLWSMCKMKRKSIWKSTSYLARCVGRLSQTRYIWWLRFPISYSLWSLISVSSNQREQMEPLDLFLFKMSQTVVGKLSTMEQSISSCKFLLYLLQIHWCRVLVEMTGEKSEDLVIVWQYAPPQQARSSQLSLH